MLHFFESFYKSLVWIGNSLQSIFLLIIRLYWGYSFFQAGIGKFNNIKSIVTFFHFIGIPYPKISAYLATSIETVGGICLVLGLASRLVSLPLIFTMIMAYLTAHRKALLSIFVDPNDFIMQVPFNYLFACILIFVFGPGKISLDYLLERYILHPRK